MVDFPSSLTSDSKGMIQAWAWMFLSGEDELAAVFDFHGVLGDEAGGEMHGTGLVCEDVEEDAIGLCICENGAGDGGISDPVSGNDRVVFDRMLSENHVGLRRGLPVDAEFYGGFALFH